MSAAMRACGQRGGARRRALVAGRSLLAATLLWIAVSLAGSAGAAGPAPGELAPDFTLTLFSARTFTLSDLKGKPVFLNFFASW